MTTALGQKIKALIRLNGPISISDYFSMCLADPEHGYYKTRDPFGQSGDFTTAPEISQLFGEMIGIFLVHAWQQHGSPKEVSIVEVGPGRGTMMADILRVIAKLAPSLYEEAEIHMVETSPLLQLAQRQTLAQHLSHITWHKDFGEVPDQFTLLVANELFDAIPIRQFVRLPDGFHERMIGLDDEDNLIFVAGAASLDPRLLPEGAERAPDGTIFEAAPARLAVMQTICDRLARAGGTALLIDYGHLATGFGDTLQAIKAHEFDPVLAHPGEADLTSHVDFQALVETALAFGVHVSGLCRQGDFLDGLGLRDRASSLMRGKDTQTIEAISVAVRRLAEAGQGNMGELFKVLAVSSPDVILAPFRVPSRQGQTVQ